ncbi:hypothetical protein F5Y17DRAFT_428440 [Xylariaceae sp. FL0594]|nr:hypothetical protein F5Y17DRAFT_428440 [Xylariaceae sp. FL0594]
MGLPLFIAPVESDIQPKAAAKPPSDPSNVRSPIRRTDRSDRRRQIREAREERVRVLAALQPTLEAQVRLLPAGDLARALSRPVVAESPSALQGGNPQLTRNAVRSSVRPADVDRATTSRVPENSGSLASGGIHRLFDDAEGSRVRQHRISQQTEDGVTQQQRAAALGVSSASYRALVASVYGSPWVRDSSAERPSWARESEGEVESARYRRRRDLETLRQSSTSGATHRHAARVRYADGLGDRDRSLSPEGDGVWDTLQSTLTPDPQPPSIGSSFASTTASVNNSSTGTSSANTSMTTPSNDVEPPCDPVNDESEDADDDTQQQLMNEHSQRPTYAAIASELARQSSETPELPAEAERLEWLSGMHRIVRALASRGDIPDEWWAQAGLSRSMSWEDSI